MIDSDGAKNQSDLAKKLGISRARVTHILNLLKLDSIIIRKLEKLGDPFKSKIITVRMLRQYVGKSSKEQIGRLFNTFKTLFKL